MIRNYAEHEITADAFGSIRESSRGSFTCASHSRSNTSGTGSEFSAARESSLRQGSWSQRGKVLSIATQLHYDIALLLGECAVCSLDYSQSGRF